MKKRINRIWIDIVQVGLLVVLVTVAINWGYFTKQVSAWFTYDVMGTTAPGEVQLDQPDRLAIPSLGLAVPLVYVDTTDEVTFQHGLENGVVHYPGTAIPGERGNAYFFGHSSDYAFKAGHYKTVFAILPRIEVGAKVYITDRTGQQFVYTVTEKKIVEAKDVSVLGQPSSKQKILTLQTSWPLGTALKRYVVVGELE